jgi:hypothetical protein
MRMRFGSVIPFNFINFLRVVPKRLAIRVRVSPSLMVYRFVAEAVGVGDGLGVGEAEGVGEVVGLGETVGVGVGLVGAGDAVGVGRGATSSATTGVPVLTALPVGIRAAKALSTAIALGLVPFRLSY